MKRKRNIKEEQAKKEPVAQDEERDNRNNNYLDLQNFFKAPDQISSDDVIGANANPYHFRSWWNAIQALPKQNYEQRAVLYQRALHYLPGSYKLWYNFLKESRHFVKDKFDPLTQPSHYEVVNDLHERALVYMNKMPKIWLDYAKFLGHRQQMISRTRHIYDRALLSLPVTQHQLIWGFYLEWACSIGDGGFTETAQNAFRRYIEFKPEDTENYIDYLLRNDLLEEALDLYIKLLSDEGFVSQKGKTRYQLWMELCEFIAKNPSRCNFQDPDRIIRHGIRKYTDEVGKLWIFLADYYTRLGLFGKARDAFEEALATITTARDFGIIFNAYMKFEEQMVEAEALENQDQDEEDDDEEDGGLEDQIDALIEYTFKDIKDKEMNENEENNKDENEEKFGFKKSDEIDLRFFRLENLIQRRPFLLSNTVLRQNPNNVYEWLNRIKLCEDDPYMAIKTYTEAITSVDPSEAFGKPSKIWINFGQYYENNEDLENANLIFHKASQLEYKQVDELASIYCAWAEMHIRQRNYESALIIMQHACTSGNPSKRQRRQQQQQKNNPNNTIQAPTNILYNNVKVWSFYVDLLESLSTVENTKLAYERMMDMKIATPQTILNFTSFLQKNNYYEESFRIYERAITLFNWPHVYEIWASYLSKIIERYADSKVERIRDLFEQVLRSAPTKEAKLFFYMYADYEENFGLINHAMEIYDRASKELAKEDQFEVFNLYISKAAEFYGVSRTRQLFERAFEVLSGLDLIEIGLRFAKLERKLGEIDRARAVYQHLSQFCNPRVKDNDEKFWGIWEKFEVYHGNEDTYSDYMKTKRTVELKYSVLNPTLSLEKPSEMMQEIQEISDKNQAEMDDKIQQPN